MAIEFQETDGRSIPGGGGISVTVTFSRPVLRASAFLQSCLLQYTNGDHHIRQFFAGAIVNRIEGNTVSVTVEGNMLDDSNNFADLVISAVVIAEVQD